MNHFLITFSNEIKDSRKEIFNEVMSMKDSLQDTESGAYYFNYKGKIVGYEWSKQENKVTILYFLDVI